MQKQEIIQGQYDHIDTIIKTLHARDRHAKGHGAQSKAGSKAGGTKPSSKASPEPS